MTDRLGVKLSANKAKRSVVVARALPYLLVLIAFALRIYRIDYQSIWRDEGVSLHLAASSIPAILAERAGNVHPPLYFILLHFWTRLAGFSEMSARFFSLSFGVLLIPSLYHAVRRVFETKTALTTAAIATFSPLYIVYCQEIRAYSMLPLCYLFIIYLLYQLARDTNWAWKHWIELLAVEVVCLYIHYSSLLAVAYANLFIAVLWLRHRGINQRHWLFSQGLVALTCVPWAWMVVRHWMTEGPPLSYLGDSSPAMGINLFEVANLLWHFWIGGYDLRSHHLFVALSSLLAAALVMALPFVIRADRRRSQTLLTLGHWVAPLTMAFAIWWWKPMVSPRYVIMFTVPFFIFLGRAMAVSIKAGGAARLTGAFLTVALGATYLLGLEIVYFDPGYAKDDVRGMVKYLESLSSANEIIVVHKLDYSVEYYYTGDASIAMIDPSQPQDLAWLEEALSGKERAFLAWSFGTPLIRDPLSFLLEMKGRLVERRTFRGYNLAIYELEQTGSSLVIQPISADFGDLRLTGAFYQKEVAANEAICLALRWQLDRATEKTYKATILLWDEEGHHLSGSDVLLLDKRSLPTSNWLPGEETINYYVVPIPIGTPPLHYRITVGVYDADTVKRLSFLDTAGNPVGEDFSLGAVKLDRARDFDHDPYGTRRAFSLKTLDEPEVRPWKTGPPSVQMRLLA